MQAKGVFADIIIPFSYITQDSILPYLIFLPLIFPTTTGGGGLGQERMEWEQRISTCRIKQEPIEIPISSTLTGQPQTWLLRLSDKWVRMVIKLVNTTGLFYLSLTQNKQSALNCTYTLAPPKKAHWIDTDLPRGRSPFRRAAEATATFFSFLPIAVSDKRTHVPQ